MVELRRVAEGEDDVPGPVEVAVGFAIDGEPGVSFVTLDR